MKLQWLDSGWRFRLLLMILVAVIVGMPVAAELSGFDTTAVGLTVTVVGVLFASGRAGCRKVVIPVILVAALVWVCAANPDSAVEGVHFLAVAALLFFSTGVTITYLRSRHEIDQEALAAAAAVYLLFGLACGAVYASISEWRPGGLEFEGISRDPDLHDHVYFSFVVLTTIGFGDIVPRGALHRSIAMLEGIVGLFYMAIVISRLVSLYHRADIRKKA